LAGNLLEIKINQPPRPLGLVFRKRLVDQIEKGPTPARGYPRKLILISAPAGFGKTTLALQWAERWEGRTAWFSLNPNDNDPYLFWTYLISSLQKVEPGLGDFALENIRSGAQTPQPAPDQSILVSFLNELVSIEQPLFLVLDDYHLIEEKTIQENLAFFIENLPPKIQVVVTTRSDPPWPLARWRARGQLTEIRGDRLRFNGEEVKEFLNIFGLEEISEDNLRDLIRKTEGWVTSLQMVAHSLQNQKDLRSFIRNFTGSHRHILNFLTEEVLAQQNPEIQDFLLETSIIKTLDPDICRAVTGRGDSQEILAQLDNKNLFISPLDPDGFRYRYHPLFADLLYFQLTSRREDIIPTLHARAAQHLLDKGEPGRAVQHALAGDDLQWAVEIINKDPEKLWKQEGNHQISRWLEQIPFDLLKKFPRLFAYKAFFLIIKGNLKDLEPLMKRTGEVEFSEEKEKKEFEGMIALIKTYLAIFQNDQQAILANSREIREKLHPDKTLFHSFAALAAGDALALEGNLTQASEEFSRAITLAKKSGQHFSTLLAGWKLANIHWFRGLLEEASHICQEMLTFAEENNLSRMPRTGPLLALEGLVERDRNQLEKAREKVETAVKICKPEKQVLAWSLYCLILVCFSSKNFSRAKQALAEIDKIKREDGIPQVLSSWVSAWKARIYLEEGDLILARDYLNQQDVNFETKPPLGQEKGHLVLARLEIAEGNIPTAGKLLNKLEENLKGNDGRRVRIEVLLLKTLVAFHTQGPEAAIPFLTEALTLGSREDFFQPFLDEGEEIIRLLPKIPPKRQVSRFAAKILHRVGEKDAEGHREKLTPSEITSLSPREMEILQFLARGSSNQEIADKLFLSIGTVKWHISNIYTKLLVEKRVEAIERARELNLIKENN